MAKGEWGGVLQQRVFRVNILFTHGGQRCQTGFHLRDVGLNTLDPEDVATEVGDFASVQFIKLLNAADKLLGVDVENLVSREGHSISYNNVAGTVGGLLPPSFLTIPVSFKGSIRRRYGSGRALWPIASQNAIDGNSITNTYIAMYNEVITDMTSRFMGPSITTSMQLVHLHDVLPPVGSRPEIPASWYDVTSIRLNTTVSFLKRRKQGVGL